MAVTRQVADGGKRDCRLAAAGLADEAVGLVLSNRERQIRDHPQVAASNAVGDVEVPHVERGFRPRRRLIGATLRRPTPANACGGRRALDALRPECLLDSVGYEVHPDHQRGDGDRRGEHRPVVAVVRRVAQEPEVVGDLQRPVRRRRLNTETEEGEPGNREDRIAEPHSRLDDDRPGDVRQDLAEHHVRAALLAQLRRLHIVELPLRERGRANRARDDRREHDADHEDDRRPRAAQGDKRDDRDDHDRNRQDGVDDAADDVIDETAVVRRQQAEDRPADDADDHCQRCDREDVAGTRKHT